MQRIIKLFAVIFILASTTQVNAEQQWLDKIDIAQYKNRVVYLDFWASWCGPCRKSFPWLNEMQAKYQDKGLVIIGINLDKEIKSAQRFVDAFPANFRLYSDPQGVLAQQYKLVGMPSSYLLSGNGQLIDTHIGFKKSEQQAYEAKIVKLLEQLDNNQ